MKKGDEIYEYASMGVYLCITVFYKFHNEGKKESNLLNI